MKRRWVDRRGPPWEESAREARRVRTELRRVESSRSVYGGICGCGAGCGVVEYLASGGDGRGCGFCGISKRRIVRRSTMSDSCFACCAGGRSVMAAKLSGRIEVRRSCSMACIWGCGCDLCRIRSTKSNSMCVQNVERFSLWSIRQLRVNRSSMAR